MTKIIRHLFSILRYPLAFLRFKHFGSFIQLGPNGVFLRPWEIALGTNVFISRNFHISANNLTIGSNVLIGPNLLIECEDHAFSRPGKTMWEMRAEKKTGSVTIEDDVWIGGNVVILKNVIIGEGAVIGAGSVVTRNLPPYSISVGNPCRPIKARFSADELRTHVGAVQSKKTADTILAEWKKSNLV